LQFRGRRQPEELLLAGATPGNRGRGQFLDSFYHHTAEQLELAIVTRGQVRIATPSELLRLTPGRLLVIERGVYHAQLSPPEGHEYDMYWCHLNQAYAHLSLLRHTSEGAVVHPEWELAGRTNVEQMGNAIAHELATREWDHVAAVAALLEYLTCLLIRRARRGSLVPRQRQEAPSIDLDPRTSSLLQAALDFCDAHFREGITQADVAHAVGCSPRYLSRLASGHLGHSLSHHLRNLRIAEARYLLDNTELPVRTIAAAVGYPDPAHFTRAFTRDVGVGPDGFRRRLGRA
jgi:AraC-like DNA-binding protein